MGQFEIANEIGIMAGARNAEYSLQSTFTNAPVNVASGVYLQNTVFAMVDIFMWLDPAAFQSRLKITTVDLLATYTATVNGTAVAYDASITTPATLPALLVELASAINAHGTVGLLVTALAFDSDGDGTIDCISLKNKTEATTHTTTFGATGTGVVSVTEDATAATLDIWMLPGGTGAKPQIWNVPNGLKALTLDRKGWAERVGVGSRDRIYVQLSSITTPSTHTTHAQAYVGPCILEGDLD